MNWLCAVGEWFSSVLLPFIHNVVYHTEYIEAVWLKIPIVDNNTAALCEGITDYEVGDLLGEVCATTHGSPPLSNVLWSWANGSFVAVSLCHEWPPPTGFSFHFPQYSSCLGCIRLGVRGIKKVRWDASCCKGMGNVIMILETYIQCVLL